MKTSPESCLPISASPRNKQSYNAPEHTPGFAHCDLQTKRALATEIKYLHGVSSHRFPGGAVCPVPRFWVRVPPGLVLDSRILVGPFYRGIFYDSAPLHLPQGLDCEGMGQDRSGRITTVRLVSSSPSWALSHLCLTRPDWNRPCCSPRISSRDVRLFLNNSFGYSVLVYLLISSFFSWTFGNAHLVLRCTALWCDTALLPSAVKTMLTKGFWRRH